ncbi:MAG: putative dsRNA-binding protein [Methanolinea sp.]
MALGETTDDYEGRLKQFLLRHGIDPAGRSPGDMARFVAAFTHRSFAKGRPPGDRGTDDYEALEFLGDRVLNLVVAERIFRNSAGSVGEMADRMEFVKNAHLSAVVAALGDEFPRLVRLGPNQELTGSIVASAFEAFLGAYFLAAGFEETRALLLGLLGDTLDTFTPFANYKKRLQEHLQKTYRKLPVYELVKKEGPDHAPVFTYRVLLDGTPLGQGTGRSKMEATQNAAREALRALGIG